MDLRCSRLIGLGVVAVAVLVGCGPNRDEGDTLFCANSETVLAEDDEPSGYEACAAGPVHRAQAVECRFDPAAPGDCPADAADDSRCRSDADCSDAAQRCQTIETEPILRCSCQESSPCQSDADCDDGQACFCDGVRSSCIPASCRIDADCPDGSLCALHERTQVCRSEYRTLACVAADDACHSAADCQTGDLCLPQQDGSWACEFFIPPPCG